MQRGCNGTNHHCKPQWSSDRQVFSGGKTRIEVSLGRLTMCLCRRAPTRQTNLGSWHKRLITNAPLRGRETRSDPSHWSSVHVSGSAHRSDSGFKTHEYQFTTCPLPNKGIVGVWLSETQAHLRSTDGYVKEGVGLHWVGDNWNNRFWMLLPIRSAEDVQTNPRDREQTIHDGLRVIKKQLTLSTLFFDLRKR